LAVVARGDGGHPQEQTLRDFSDIFEFDQETIFESGVEHGTENDNENMYYSRLASSRSGAAATAVLEAASHESRARPCGQEPGRGERQAR
jgi:hypothetical protein